MDKYKQHIGTIKYLKNGREWGRRQQWRSGAHCSSSAQMCGTAGKSSPCGICCKKYKWKLPLKNKVDSYISILKRIRWRKKKFKTKDKKLNEPTAIMRIVKITERTRLIRRRIRQCERSCRCRGRGRWPGRRQSASAAETAASSAREYPAIN